MKRLLNKAIILALMAATWVSCSQDEAIADFETAIVQESESDIHINLNLNIPDPIQMTSRTGEIVESIQNITVLCFDKDSYALTKLVADITPTGVESGSLSVKIPNATRVMHVFANQETVPFEKGMSEYDARLTGLQVASSETMVYWARIEVPSTLTSSSDIKNWWTSEGKTVTLLRNQAKIEVLNNTDDFVLQGYAVVHTNAYGMAIPYYAAGSAYPTNAMAGSTPAFSVTNWISTDYIHATTDNVTTYGSDESMQTEGDIYVYETPADAELKASIIIKGYNTSDPDKQTKYWRVAFADEEGNQVNIRRNHRYTVSIEGTILFGDESFEAAVANTSTANSAWLGIADEVTAVKTKNYSLTVENTSYVKMDGTESVDFNFYIEQLGEDGFAASDLSVTWEDGQNVSSDNAVNYTSELSKNAAGKDLFKGSVTVALKRLATGAARQEGTIVIKYGKKLQRKVKVIVIPQQNFEIVSYNGVTTETKIETTDKVDTYYYTISVNKDDYEKDDYTIDGAPIDKLKFRIPSGYPTQLLPFNVLVSTTDFNVVDSPLIFEGAGGYGEKNEIGYKYVYPVSAVGTEYEISLRYISNLLASRVVVTLDAENFKRVTLVIDYTLNTTEEEETTESTEDNE